MVARAECISSRPRLMSILALFFVLSCMGCREAYRYEIMDDQQGPLPADPIIEDPADEPPPPITGWPTPSLHLKRLTQAQYRTLIRSVFGESVTLSAPLPRDLEVDGSRALGTTLSTLTDREVEQYARAAEEIAEQVVSTPEILALFDLCVARVSLLSAPEDDQALLDVKDCLEAVGSSMMSQLWGRALSAEEETRLSALMIDGWRVFDLPVEALSLSLSWALQSPHFLFRVERLTEDQALLDPHTLAERLSYFLHNSPPDEQLRVAGDALHSRAEWRRHVERLLRSPRLEQGVRALFDDMWSLWRVETLHLSKDPELFEHLSAQLGPSAREETLMGVWRLTEEDAPLSELFTRRETYVDAKLASIYGVPAPAREGFGWTRLSERESRLGILGQVSFLALNSHPTSTSSTLRGQFVLDRFLCSPPPPPPSGVDTSIPEPTPDRPTLRDRLESHLEEPTCAGCHRSMDMIGLVYEGFDAIGRSRRFEQGVEIDPRGELLGEAVSGPVELAHALAQHPKLAPCLTKRVFRYARGIYASEEELHLIDRHSESVEQGEFTLKTLLMEIALSEGFHGPFIDQEGE